MRIRQKCSGAISIEATPGEDGTDSKRRCGIDKRRASINDKSGREILRERNQNTERCSSKGESFNRKILTNTRSSASNKNSRSIIRNNDEPINTAELVYAIPKQDTSRNYKHFSRKWTINNTTVRFYNIKIR